MRRYICVCMYVCIYIYIFVNFILTPLMFASVLISFCFLLTQFPLSISSNLILSVSSGLRKIELLDLAYKLSD